MKIISIVFLVSFAFFLCFYRLGARPPEMWDEITNIDVLRSSRYTASIGYLFLKGKPFFEKPPLWYITTHAASKFISDEITAVRTVSAVSGFLTILSVLFIGEIYLSPWSGIVASSILLGTGQLFRLNAAGFFSTHFVRSADPDMQQILCIILALIAFLKSNSKKPIFGYLGTFFTALAVLTKGPLGILPLLTFGIIELHIYGKSRVPYLMKLSLFLLAIIVPWHILMMKTYGIKFLVDYAGYHILLRAISPIENHINPWWYYLQILLHPDISPAFPLFLVSIYYAMQKIRTGCKPFMYIVCIASMMMTILFFTQTKLAWYLLPIHPFMALLSGYGWTRIYLFLSHDTIPKYSKIFLTLILSISVFTILFGITKNILAVI